MSKGGRYNQWWSLLIVFLNTFLNEFLFTKIEEEDIGNISTGRRYVHTAEATLDVLRPVFEDCIISCRADIVWPPRSCDFTPLHCFLWGAVKDKCYADKPETIDGLKDNIREIQWNPAAIIIFHY